MCFAALQALFMRVGVERFSSSILRYIASEVSRASYFFAFSIRPISPETVMLWLGEALGSKYAKGNSFLEVYLEVRGIRLHTVSSENTP